LIGLVDSSDERGILYVVGTPIGNLEDITLRALSTLREVSAVACEDTRTTRKLLVRHGIETQTLAFHAHSGAAEVEQICARIEDGAHIALVTDAGTPGVSDPGEVLVAAAIARGIEVVPIPGASAVVTAISASGLPARFVLFLGFLPREDVEQREILAPLRDAPYTLVLYESPRRVGETLAALKRSLGDRAAVVCRELTKKFETFERGLLSELEERFREDAIGEITVVVAPPVKGDAKIDLDRAREEARRLLAAGERTGDIAKIIAGAHGLARQEAYQLVLELKSGADENT
jgi:16S rRNA (cytidine1402-2'-O)-methyltransferase